MGIEYRISCLPDKLPQFSEFLRRMGGQSPQQTPAQIEFCVRPHSLNSGPDVTAVVEPNGIYFCDHGSAPQQVAVLFRRIVDEALRLSDSSDSVLITSL